jgi:enoyl-CoA hydratase/carnithine racemase
MAEPDEAVKVRVFKSADPDYFMPHADTTRIKEYREEAAKLTGEASLALLFRRLSASRLITIAQIEGRVRAGSLTMRAPDPYHDLIEMDISDQLLSHHSRVLRGYGPGYSWR